MPTTNNPHSFFNKVNIKGIIKHSVLLVATSIYLIGHFGQEIQAQENKTNNKGANELLIQQYIQSKGSEIIIFDASNIKRFWINRSVISKKDLFDIILDKKNRFESEPLRIQLANVNEKMDCSIEVLTETSDVEFSVYDSKLNRLSDSTPQNSFLQYNVISSVFHLEETISEDLENYAFNLKFFSKSAETIQVKAIIISFFTNKKPAYFLAHPGQLEITKESIMDQRNVSIDDDKSLTINKTSFKELRIKNNIYVSENPITFSAKYKNTGNTDFITVFYFRYEFYSNDHKRLGAENYPYKNNNTIMHIVSAEKGNNKIVVDSYVDWGKNCYLALNAKEDRSDLPNRHLLEEKIVEMKKIDDHHTEIVLDKALSKNIEKGTSVRVHGSNLHQVQIGAISLLSEGEIIFTHTTAEMNNCFVYSKDAIPKGTYYIKPVLILASDKQFSFSFRDIEISF